MPPTRRHLRFGIVGALAFSFALHVALAPFVRVARASGAPSPPDSPLTIALRSRSEPSPVPRPHVTPTPRPMPAIPIVRASAGTRIARVPRVRRPSVRAHAFATGIPARPRIAGASSGVAARIGTVSSGSEAVAVLAGAPGEAAPASSPTPPACERPDADARVVVAVEPNMPEIVHEGQASGSVAVRVDLSETGAVESASVAQSSNAAFDAAALDAARRSTYAPAVSGCRAHGGSYLFRAEFDG